DEPDGTSSGSTQGSWLETQLINCVANHNHWRVVYFHHPAYSTEYSSGGHGSNSYMQWDFIGWGAHVVLAGHAHKYERLFIGGLTYFVNGLGGRDTHNSVTPISGSEFIYGDDFGAQLVTVDGTDITFEFHSISDGLVDTKTIIDEALPVELTSFTASVKNNQVLLKWETETEVNNYGFDIERTKDNSDWLTIGFVEGHGNSNSPKQYNFIDTDINQSGTYYYRLKQIDNDGTYEYSDVVSVEVGVPNNFFLSQNYPNPFNPETRIDFTLPQKQLVFIRVYNTLGERVTELVSEEREAGSYSVIFDASKLPSGVYIYRLQTPGFTDNKKMTLLK
ncbi:MAG: T9SS type A sorting domain-containing protein, partial [Bacteroidetes bacterium]|nr:T9SS type A sorting domain-containing protein [Bacteroidota bacterium]